MITIPHATEAIRMQAFQTHTVAQPISIQPLQTQQKPCVTQARHNAEKHSSVVVPKRFIKHMCFIVFYFHGHAFFSLEIAKKCFFVLYFLKNVLYFCKLFKWVEYLFQVFIYNTKIGEL